MTRADELATGTRIRDDSHNIVTVEYVVPALHTDHCVVHVIDVLGYRRAWTVPRRRDYQEES